MALTGITSCVLLDFRFFGNLFLVGSSTLALTFVVLSGGFLNAFLCDLFLGIGICYYFFNVLKNAQ